MSRQVNSIIVIVDWSWGWSETEHVYGKQVEIVIDFHVPCPQCSSIAHARVLGIHQSFLDRKLEPRLVMIGNQLWNDCTCWESNAINRPPNSPWMAGLLLFFPTLHVLLLMQPVADGHDLLHYPKIREESRSLWTMVWILGLLRSR